MNDIVYDPARCLINVASSALSYFGVKPFHETLKCLDEILNGRKPQKVAILLFDGLNTYVKNKNLKPDDSLIRHTKLSVTSVFPATTVAATTALLSGRFPCETGWLGWSQYFRDFDVTLDMFTNTISKTDQKYSRALSEELCSYESIIDLINKSGNGTAEILRPHAIGGQAKNLSHFFELLDRKLCGRNKSFLYAYWPDPDAIMHVEGVSSRKVKQVIRYIDKHVARIASKHKETLFLVLADHGMIDIKLQRIDEHPDFYALLERKPCLDCRATMFFVAPKNQKRFESLFDRYYGPYFLLKTKKEIIEEHWFGIGISHPMFESFLGDYMAVSISDRTFFIPNESGETIPVVAAHSGILKEETEIGIAVYNDEFPLL